MSSTALRVKTTFHLKANFLNISVGLVMHRPYPRLVMETKEANARNDDMRGIFGVCWLHDIREILEELISIWRSKIDLILYS